MDSLLRLLINRNEDEIPDLWRCSELKVKNMRADIHPNYGAMTATCSCGNIIQTKSTLAKDIHVDVCSACHPFYTGKQKNADSGGRIDKFNKRFGARKAS